MASHKRIGIITIVLGLVVILILVGFIPGSCVSSANVHATLTKAQLGNLIVALTAYQTDYSEFPTGSNSEIINVLKGENPRHIVFLEITPNNFVNGEFVDPWHSPYRIGVSRDAYPWAYSFGKNKIDEGGAFGSDDIASWR